MNKPRLQAQKPTLEWRCIGGEDPRIRRTKTNEVGLSWNKLISPNIWGWMKKAQYRMMSIGRTGRIFGSSTAFFSRGGSSSLRPRGYHSSPGEGSHLVVSLKYHGTGKGPMGSHWSRVQIFFNISLSLSSPTRG
jgi:hypothetical protein